MGQVHDIAAVHAEESVGHQLGLQLCQRDGGQIAIGIRIDAGIIVLGLDVANLIDRHQHLAAALLHRDALLRRVGRGHRRHAALHLVQGGYQTVGLHRLHEIVHGVDVKGLHRILAVGGHKDHRRRVLELMQGLCQLHPAGLGHGDIQKQDVRPSLNDLFHRFARAGSLVNGVYPAGLFQQKAQFRARRSFIVHDHCTEHSITSWVVHLQIIKERQPNLEQGPVVDKLLYLL